jgi:acyl-CoA reductase-like NAD-dependent aldehyde dehydrogenase
MDTGVEVRDPRTGRVDRLLAAPTREELAATCRRLRAAQPVWEALGAAGRADVLRRWAAALRERAAEVVAALVADTGRRSESELELEITAAGIERWARQAPALLDTAGERPSSVPGVVLRGGLRPYPLVGVISPWNFPLLLGLLDAVPALAAGCAVVVKPSEVTPRFLGPLRETLVPELAPVLALAEGAAETGQALLSEVDFVAFTGSVPTGRLVAEAAARRLLPVSLELGGKDPAIVLAGADLDRAARAVLWGGTANAGQSCLSIERVYVEAGLHDEFVDRLVALAAKVDLAYPDVDSGQLGPIIAADQVGVIERHLADAYARGARALTGGAVERLGGGAYVRPTVLVGADHSMAVMTEETFGPVLPVMPVSGVDEAVRMANDTVYGLSAAVFAGGEAEALAVAARIDAGAVSVDDAALTAVVQEGEKNSFGLSGLGGSRMGPASVARFVRRQSFLVHRGPRPDAWWYDL